MLTLDKSDLWLLYTLLITDMMNKWSNRSNRSWFRLYNLHDLKNILHSEDVTQVCNLIGTENFKIVCFVRVVGCTIEELYPDIIAWFNEQDDSIIRYERMFIITSDELVLYFTLRWL
jgi:hypothetical protein